MCKTVQEKLQTKLCPRTNRQTDKQKDGQPWAIPVYPPPLRCGGITKFKTHMFKSLYLLKPRS